MADAIPPEVKERVDAVQPYIQKSIEFTTTYRTPLIIAVVSLLGIAGFSYYRTRFVGYSGDILPVKVLELLESDAPALLVDIRSEDEQQREGAPKLRRKALGKAISVPFCRMDPQLKTLLKLSPDLDADVTASYIAGHKRVRYHRQRTS